jgi:phosphatidylinositol kinase/protein kinase (PI-3  family)
VQLCFLYHSVLVWSRMLHFSQHSHYYVRIARFMPRVDIVQKHNTAARRLFIRGHNGKIYPYLVVNDSGLGDARREERVLQLLRMLNHYLGKQKVREIIGCFDNVLHTTDCSWS